MGLKGRLTRASMGSTMPADAPVFHRKPFYFKGARMLRCDYETDGGAAAEIVPEPLEISDPPTAFLLINEYPWSTLGPYREAVLGVNVLFRGEPLHYLTHLMLDREVPVLAGREIYGFPKKMGVVEWIAQDDLLAGYVERPRGIRLCSIVFRPEAPLDPLPDGTPLVTCGLRILASPEKDRDHSSVELIRTDMILSSAQVWAGTGNCHFTGASVLDPWHRLPVRKMVAATHIVADFVLSTGTVLASL